MQGEGEEFEETFDEDKMLQLILKPISTALDPAWRSDVQGSCASFGPT